MKKFILSVSLSVLFFIPSASHASYIIYLKNGGHFVTSQYWKEDNLIIFFVNGGTMGIDKETVEKIQKANSDSEEKESEIDKFKQPDLPDFQKSEKVMNKKFVPDAADVKQEKVDLKTYEEKMANLKAELNKTLIRLKKAEIDKDMDAKSEAIEDNRRISAEMWKLTDELKNKNNGNLPADWWKGVGRKGAAQ